MCEKTHKYKHTSEESKDRLRVQKNASTYVCAYILWGCYGFVVVVIIVPLLHPEMFFPEGTFGDSTSPAKNVLTKSL